MAKGSRKTLVIQSEKLPIIEGVEEYAQMGLIPEGAYRNRDFAGDEVRSEIKELWMEDLVFDPQTSGGLLIAVPAEEADALAEELAGMDIFGGVIGYVTELQDKALLSDMLCTPAEIFLVFCALPNCLECISLWNCYKNLRI